MNCLSIGIVEYRNVSVLERMNMMKALFKKVMRMLAWIFSARVLQAINDGESMEVVSRIVEEEATLKARRE